jgi:hypothetical protein
MAAGIGSFCGQTVRRGSLGGDYSDLRDSRAQSRPYAGTRACVMSRKEQLGCSVASGWGGRAGGLSTSAKCRLFSFQCWKLNPGASQILGKFSTFELHPLTLAF